MPDSKDYKAPDEIHAAAANLLFACEGKSGTAQIDMVARALRAQRSQESPVSQDALAEARSVISSINAGPSHRVKVGDEICFWQRDEWVRWALDEVLPKIDAAIASLPTQQPPSPTDRVERTAGDTGTLCPGGVERTDSNQPAREKPHGSV